MASPFQLVKLTWYLFRSRVADMSPISCFTLNVWYLSPAEEPRQIRCD